MSQDNITFPSLNVVLAKCMARLTSFVIAKKARIIANSDSGTRIHYTRLLEWRSSQQHNATAVIVNIYR